MSSYETALVGSHYAQEYGFIGYGFDASTNYTYLSVMDLLPNPISRHIEISGWGGWGMDFSRLLQLWPLLLFAVFFFYLRASLYPALRGFGVFCGIPRSSSKKLQKFQYQMWLMMYYCLSTAFGWYVLWDKPWLGFPMNAYNQLSLLVNHPHQPDEWLKWYYCYQLGFFLAEIFVIFRETRRSDFWEYVAHHTTTILLMVFSYIGYEHRIGSYILLLHDISDVFLCLTKILHYCKVMDAVVNMSFVAFIIAFFFTRLVCLPVHGFAVIFVATGKRICTVNFWLLTILLQFVLQGLHVYWFVLILRLVSRILFDSKRGDIRSDSDSGDEETRTEAAKKKQRRNEKTKQLGNSSKK